MTNARVVVEQNGNVIRKFYICRDFTEAKKIADELNRLNAEAARLTGKIISIVYKAISHV